MNNISQTFNICRFGKNIKRDLLLNNRSWLLKASLMLLGTTILLCLSTLPNINSLAYYADVQAEGAYDMFKFCGITFCALGASLFMENMTTAGQRLNSLMSPSSALEKYLTRWLICIVGVTIAFFISFAIADFIRVCIFRYAYGDINGLCYIGPWGVLKESEHWYLVWTALMSCQATFVLGSTVWPKNAFLKTFGVCVLIQTIYGLAISLAIKYGFNAFHSIHRATDFSLIDYITPTWLVVTIVWTIFCYVTAYFRLKESEIINRM